MKLLHHIFLALLALLATNNAWGAAKDLFENDDERDWMLTCGKPVYQELRPELNCAPGDTYETAPYDGVEWRYLRNRKALVGSKCSINRFIDLITVGGGRTNMGNLLNEDLSDYCNIGFGVNANIGDGAIVSVRDISAYYAKGTKAGFAMVAGSDNSWLLSLSVVKMYMIGFYRDGVRVGGKVVEEGSGGSGLSLKLVQIQGSDDAMVMFTATAPCAFDEIQLEVPGGLDLSVAKEMRIKYAFVGSAREFYIGQDSYATSEEVAANPGSILMPVVKGTSAPVGDGLHAYSRYTGRDGLDTEPTLKGFAPALLGIPIPMSATQKAKMADGNDETGSVIIPILNVGYQGGAKFTLGDSKSTEEVFPAGCEVGWKTTYGSGLALDAGCWIRMITFDRNGNKVEQLTVNAGVLGLTVGAGGSQSYMVTTSKPFSGCELRLHTTVSVNLGAIVVNNAFVRMAPDVPHHCDINPSMDTNVCSDQQSLQLKSNPKVSVIWTLPQWAVDGDGNPIYDTVTDDAGNTSKVRRPGKPAGSKAAVTSDGKVTGLTEEGIYYFVATNPNCGCFTVTTIVVGGFGEADPQCGEPLVIDELADDLAERDWITYSTDTHDTSGALISISNLENPQNVVASNTDLYATYTGGLGLANNLAIVGVKVNDNQRPRCIVDFNDPETRDLYPNGVKIGFVVEQSAAGLDLSVLEFMQIRCYDNNLSSKDIETYRSVISESNGVSATIGSRNDVTLKRFAIRVPVHDKKGNYIKFDEFQLWKSGVVDLKIDKLKIYYAFIDDADSTCDDPLGCSTTFLGPNTGTTINADATTFGGGIGIGSSYNNIMNFVDGNPDTYMDVMEVVGAGGMTLAIKLGRTLDYRHELGLIMDNNTYALNASVGSWMTVTTYFQGEPTGEDLKDWGVVGANVAGYGDKRVLFIHPQIAYDEVRIQMANIVDALNYKRFYGLAVRADIDNDGVPDCLDSNSCVTSIDDLDVNHVCVGQRIEITGHAGIDSYWYLYSNDPSFEQFMRDEHGWTPSEITPLPDVDDESVTAQAKIENLRCQVPLLEVQADAHGEFSASYVTLFPGLFTLTLYNGSALPAYSVTYTVHPTETTWKTDASNSDWSKWDNWSNGAPYCCTNVIVPSEARIYPNLARSLFVEQSTTDPETGTKTTYYEQILDQQCAQDVHLQPGAYIGYSNRLNYRRMWAEKNLSCQEGWHLLSAPLLDMHSGDWFRSENLPDYFTPLDYSNDIPVRFNPTVYQRLYLMTAKRMPYFSNVLQNVTVTETHWTSPYNHVSTTYGPGMGWSLWIDNGDRPENEMMTLRFPKTHTYYWYFSDYDQQPVKKENVPRSTGMPHRLSLEGADKKFSTISDPASSGSISYPQTFTYGYPDPVADAYTRKMWEGLDINLKLSAVETSSTFPLGNPTVSNIDILELLKLNPDITAINIYDEEAANYKVISLNGEGELVGTYDFSAGTPVIMPFQAVMVDINAPATEFMVNLTEDMLDTGEDSDAASGSAMAMMREERLNALQGGSDPMLRLTAVDGLRRSSALLISDYVEPHELYVDDNKPPHILLAVVNDKSLCDISPTDDVIPLTLILDSPANVTLELYAMNFFPRDGWQLLDRETDTYYDLENDIELGYIESSSAGRFVLVREASSVKSPVSDIQMPHVWATIQPDCHVTLTSDGPDILAVTVCDLQGHVLHTLSPNTPRATFKTSPGIMIIEAVVRELPPTRMKILVK